MQQSNPDTLQLILPNQAEMADYNTLKSIDSASLISDSIDSFYRSMTNTGRFLTETAPLKNTPEQMTHIRVYEWITFLLFAAYILLAVLNFTYQKNFIRYFRATLGRNHAHQLIRDGNPFKKRTSLFSALIYLISIPLLYYALTEYFFQFEIKIDFDIRFYLRLVALTIVLFIYKFIVIQTSSSLFKTQKPSFELLANILIFNLVIGILILPVITLYFYTQLDFFLYFAFGIYGMGIIMRFFREIMVGLSGSIFSILHLFLYLCTLEFIPIIIIGKLVIDFYMI